MLQLSFCSMESLIQLKFLLLIIEIKVLHSILQIKAMTSGSETIEAPPFQEGTWSTIRIVSIKKNDNNFLILTSQTMEIMIYQHKLVLSKILHKLINYLTLATRKARHKCSTLYQCKKTKIFLKKILTYLSPLPLWQKMIKCNPLWQNMHFNLLIILKTFYTFLEYMNFLESQQTQFLPNFVEFLRNFAITEKNSP